MTTTAVPYVPIEGWPTPYILIAATFAITIVYLTKLNGADVRVVTGIKQVYSLFVSYSVAHESYTNCWLLSLIWILYPLISIALSGLVQLSLTLQPSLEVLTCFTILGSLVAILN